MQPALVPDFMTALKMHRMERLHGRGMFGLCPEGGVVKVPVSEGTEGTLLPATRVLYLSSATVHTRLPETFYTPTSKSCP